MRKLFFVLTIAIIITNCRRSKLRFVTGVKSGTYYEFAKSIKNLDSESISIETSEGSQQIIQKILDNDADIGIVQLDILENLAIVKADVANNVKILLPLYREEIQILSLKPMKNLSDLYGRSLAIGTEQSGSHATASIIFNMLLIDKDVITLKSLTPANSFKELQSGAVYAILTVAGAPFDIFKHLRQPKAYLYSFSNLQKETIDKETYHYGSSKIKARVYPWLKNDVNTIAVRSILIGRKSLSSDSVSKLIKIILQNSKKLSTVHPKWEDLNIDSAFEFSNQMKTMFHRAAITTVNTLRKTDS